MYTKKITDIEQIEKRCDHTGCGIPKDIFLFMSRHIPMMNVDLIIKDETNRTLLSWRDDECGTGWHVPGGMIRLNEKIIERIHRTSMEEIGTVVAYDPIPITILELFVSNNNRKHCISIVYKCFLPQKYILPKKQKNTAGYLKWHNECPNNLIPVHEQYRDLIPQVKI